MVCVADASRCLSFAAILLIGTVGILLAPSSAHACSNHHWSPEPAYEKQPAEPDSGVESWTADAVRGLYAFWDFVIALPTTCRTCPDGSGQRCEGPSCSGNPSPATAPLAGPVERSHETGCLVAAVHPSNRADSHRFANSDCLPFVAACLDSIFHPPRSV
jgi:hypothetical protein